MVKGQGKEILSHLEGNTFKITPNQVTLEMKKIQLKNNWVKSYLRGRIPDPSHILSPTLSSDTHVLFL